MNIKLEKRPGFIIRVIAFYIDQLILCLLAPIIMLILNLLMFLGFNNIHILGFAISLVFIAIYFIVLESSPLKGTFGKRILGIRVTQINGDKLSVSQAALRFIYMVLCFLSFGIGFLTIIFRKDKRGVHDILAKAKVYYDDGRNIVVKTIIIVFISLVVTSLMILTTMIGWIYFHSYNEKDKLTIKKIAHDICDYTLSPQFIPRTGMDYIIAKGAFFVQTSTNEQNTICFTKTINSDIKEAFAEIKTNNAYKVITLNKKTLNPIFSSYKEKILFLPDDKIRFISLGEFKNGKSFYIIKWNSDNTNNINKARTFFESITIKK
jgi:uncharacterized RDD family membrane protein YckC